MGARQRKIKLAAGLLVGLSFLITIAGIATPWYIFEKEWTVLHSASTNPIPVSCKVIDMRGWFQDYCYFYGPKSECRFDKSFCGGKSTSNWRDDCHKQDNETDYYCLGPTEVWTSNMTFSLSLLALVFMFASFFLLIMRCCCQPSIGELLQFIFSTIGLVIIVGALYFFAMSSPVTIREQSQELGKSCSGFSCTFWWQTSNYVNQDGQHELLRRGPLGWIVTACSIPSLLAATILYSKAHKSLKPKKSFYSEL